MTVSYDYILFITFNPVACAMKPFVPIINYVPQNLECLSLTLTINLV